jgi:hypothetical protein
MITQAFLTEQFQIMLILLLRTLNFYPLLLCPELTVLYREFTIVCKIGAYGVCDKSSVANGNLF